MYILVSSAADSIISITKFYLFLWNFYVLCGNICAVCVCVYLYVCMHAHLRRRKRSFLFSFHSKAHLLIHSFLHSWQKHQWRTTTNHLAPSGTIVGAHPLVLHCFSVLLLCLHHLSSEGWMQLAQWLHGVSRMPYMVSVRPSKVGWGRGTDSSEKQKMLIPHSSVFSEAESI